MTPPIRIAILTVSDRASRDPSADESGPAIAELARAELGAEIVASDRVPDDPEAIAERLRAWALEDPRPDLVLTTGGTGLAPRDRTPEATSRILERRHPAILELARLRCLERTPRAFLSRGEAGTLGRTLIVNLPGSLRGATDTLAAILDVLPHGVRMLRGEDLEHRERSP